MQQPGNSPDQSSAASLQSLLPIHDEPQPCPYLPDQQARMPLLWSPRPLSLVETDDFLAAGYRRSGQFLYHTQCPSCAACIPTRVPASQFTWSRSLKRVLQKCDATLRVRIQPPVIDDRRLQLINLHRSSRGLGRTSEPLEQADYASFLVETCCDTQELSYWLNDQLIAVAIADVGQTAISAVYCFFDPAHSRLSLGTYSILKQLQWVQQSHRQFLYLGMYVEANPHLSYKARFLPQQRLVDGTWQTAS